MAITRDWRRQPVFSRSTFGMHMLDPEAFDVPRSTAPKVDAAVAVAMAKVVDSRKTPLGRFRLTSHKTYQSSSLASSTTLSTYKSSPVTSGATTPSLKSPSSSTFDSPSPKTKFSLKDVDAYSEADSDDSSLDVFYDALEYQEEDLVDRDAAVGDWLDRVNASTTALACTAAAANELKEVAEQPPVDCEALAAEAIVAELAVEVVAQVVDEPLMVDSPEDAMVLEDDVFSSWAPVDAPAAVVEVERHASSLQLVGHVANLDFLSSPASLELSGEDNSMEIDDMETYVDCSQSLNAPVYDAMEIDDDDSWSHPATVALGGNLSTNVDHTYSLDKSLSARTSAAASGPIPMDDDEAPLFSAPAPQGRKDERKNGLDGKKVFSPVGIELFVPNGMGRARPAVAPAPVVSPPAPVRREERGNGALGKTVVSPVGLSLFLPTAMGSGPVATGNHGRQLGNSTAAAGPGDKARAIKPMRRRRGPVIA
ncbi:hypothetical protein JCM8208_000076 [Rhodotorula glutinis]